MLKSLFLAFLMGAAAPVLAQSGEHQGHSDMTAPTQVMILEGYGDGGFPITTSNPQAQAFFNNGMQLAHAFAHSAAVAAMHEARRLDRKCAMCLWGEAWADGPTINFGKEGKELRHIGKLAGKAQRLARKHGTPKERALTEALVARYRNGGGGKPGDLAFANAMQQLADSYSDDDEIAVIAADAWLMTPGSGPKSDADHARRSIPLLERVLNRNREYAPAIHFYIHATELAGEPAKAEAYADRLGVVAPNASHLIHMPSHTWYWVGRYQDAATANARAVEIGIAQARKLGLPEPDGLWGLPYHVHNITFGIGGALMAGDSSVAMGLAKPLVEMAAARTDISAFRQIVASNGYFAFARFGEPAVALALPEPRLPILKGSWHYMRGEVLAKEGKAAEVRAEAAAIPSLSGKLNDEDATAAAAHLLTIERLVLEGRAAMLEGKPSEALTRFEKAAAMQEEATFSYFADPPAFWYPVRRNVAEAKLAMGDVAGARAELDTSLKLRPKDPAALALLATLEAATAAR